MPETTYAADLSQIQAAATRIADGIHRTPILTSAALDDLSGRTLFFKCENLQRMGAFKMRGALNAVRCLPAEVKAVATHSSGNFAQALALSARVCGLDAHIVMPRTAPAVKQRAVAGYGGHITLCEPTLAAREETAAAVVNATGATLLHPFDHPDVIAGQGTVALEVLDEVPDVDTLVAPLGGGGLLSGIALAAAGKAPGVRVIGVEPEGADDAYRSRLAGKLIPQTDPDTIADGLLTSLGALTWPVVRDVVSDVCRVSDTQTIEAMRLVWERMKIVIEPSAAVAVAAALFGHLGADARRVGIILSGGNVDLAKLPW